MTHRDVVVVGASAGGVEALQALVAGLPAGFPAAVLAVLHVPAHSPSRLDEILDAAGPLPVAVAEDGAPVEPGRVLVAPADRHLLVEGDGAGGARVRVTRGPKENRHRPAVDALFRSAAYACGPRVVGVVLSGMLDDGTAGLWAVKDRGGLALVQAPADAQFPSMPESALAHVAVDAELAVADLPALLCRATAAPLAHVAVGGPSDGEPSETLRVETRIALEGNGLQQGVMDLGPISGNTCPECHGVLVRVEEGPVARYRCHTGHAFSLQTLLAGVNGEIDRTLWSAVRAIEERILLLRETAEVSRARGDEGAAERCSEQAGVAERYVEQVRALVLSHDLFGRVDGSL